MSQGRRGRSSCACPEAARSASPSTRMIRTPSTPGCARAACGEPSDAGRSWVDCALPEPGVFSLAVSAVDGAVYAGTEPSRLFRSDDRGESWRELEALLELPSRPSWSFPPRPWTSHVRWIAPSPYDADLLLRRDRAGRPDALHRRRHKLAGPSPRRATRRALARLAPTRTRPRLRGRRRWRRLQHERRRDLAASRRGPRPPLHLVDHRRPATARSCWYLSASTGPYAAHGRRDPQARIYRRRDGEPWRRSPAGYRSRSRRCPTHCSSPAVASSPASPTGRLWESRDGGDSWAALRLEGDALGSLVALVDAGG